MVPFNLALFRPIEILVIKTITDFALGKIFSLLKTVGGKTVSRPAIWRLYTRPRLPCSLNSVNEVIKYLAI